MVSLSGRNDQSFVARFQGLCLVLCTMQRCPIDGRFHADTPLHMRRPLQAEAADELNSRLNYEAVCDEYGELPVRVPPAAPAQATLREVENMCVRHTWCGDVCIARCTSSSRARSRCSTCRRGASKARSRTFGSEFFGARSELCPLWVFVGAICSLRSVGLRFMLVQLYAAAAARCMCYINTSATSKRMRML